MQINCNYPRKCNLQHCCNGVTKEWCENNVKPDGATLENGNWVVKRPCNCTKQVQQCTLHVNPNTGDTEPLCTNQTTPYTESDSYLVKISERSTPYSDFKTETCCIGKVNTIIRNGCSGTCTFPPNSVPNENAHLIPLNTLTLVPFDLKDSRHLK